MNGVLNLYKPRGITSSDAVVRVRRVLNTRAVGHFGTLDPMAEGVLLLGVGKATRLFDYMLGKDKVYRAEFTFGYDTDTLDAEGTVVNQGGAIPTLQSINSALTAFTGCQQQLPPAYSSKSVNGVRAYTLARRGQEVALKPAEIEIFSFTAQETDCKDKFSFTITCSSGTYIRSICRDLAAALKTYATMTALKRLRCGEYAAENAYSFERLKEVKTGALIGLDEALSALPKVQLDDDCYPYLLNGIKMESRGVNYGKFTLYCRKELFGIATVNAAGKIEITSYLR